MEKEKKKRLTLDEKVEKAKAAYEKLLKKKDEDERKRLDSAIKNRNFTMQQAIYAVENFNFDNVNNIETEEVNDIVSANNDKHIFGSSTDTEKPLVNKEEI